MEEEFIYMICHSKKGSIDWYGDFCYCDNPLQKYYTDSKLWEYKLERCFGSHGIGIPGIGVKTTMNNLKIMGWESDYNDYKCSEEIYNKI